MKKVELKDLINLYIPDDVLNKIKFLCKMIAKVEWSGILFYETKGSVQNTDKFKIILKDIFLMDKGDKTATSFDWDEDIVKYRMANLAAIDWKVGHIHSHNDMGVFFSGTDWSELNDNSPLHNIYLSLIVNNYLDMKAKIAFTGHVNNQFTCKTEEGEDYVLELEGHDVDVMFVYDCTVNSKVQKISVPKAFMDRFKEIDEKPKPATTYNSANNTYGGWDSSKQSTQKSAFPGWEGSKNQKSLGYGANWGDADEKFTAPISNNNTMRVVDDRAKGEDVSETEAFAAFVVRLGNHQEDDDLVNALEDLEIANLNHNSLIDSIVHSYPTYYAAFFDKDKDRDSDKRFLEVTEGVVEELSYNGATFNIVAPLMEALQKLMNRYKTSLSKR